MISLFYDYDAIKETETSKPFFNKYSRITCKTNINNFRADNRSLWLKNRYGYTQEVKYFHSFFK